MQTDGRVETESGGTRQRTGGEVKGKEANGVGSQEVFSFTRNSPSSVTTIVLPRPAPQESQYSTELTPPLCSQFLNNSGAVTGKGSHNARPLRFPAFISRIESIAFANLANLTRFQVHCKPNKTLRKRDSRSS